MSFCLLAVLYSGAQTTFQNYISAYSTAAAGFTVAESITVSMVFTGQWIYSQPHSEAARTRGSRLETCNDA